MDIDKAQNQEESNTFIEKELEEESNEFEKREELNEMEYYCDEPSELIDVKYIEEYSRQNFFGDNNEPNINQQIINYDNYQLYYNNNNNYIYNNYNNIFNNYNCNYYPNNIINQNSNDIKNKIFNIAKYTRYREYNNINNVKMKKFNLKKKYYKYPSINWDTIEVPKEKHFHFDRKKHRIVFQRKHLKVIYSVIGLTPPINFIKCFNMIKEQIGEKTLQNFGKGKSFHIIRDNGEEKIVTLKDKKNKLKKYNYKNGKENKKNIDEKELTINN